MYHNKHHPYVHLQYSTVSFFKSCSSSMNPQNITVLKFKRTILTLPLINFYINYYFSPSEGTLTYRQPLPKYNLTKANL